MASKNSMLTAEEAERALKTAIESSPDAAIIVDFDETLWLRNSTEEFLRSLRPRWLGHLVLLGLELVRPWKLMPHTRREHVFRDWMRVRTCTLIMPWSLRNWRRQAPCNAERWANRRLLKVLAEAGPKRTLLVATLGTDLLVEPLLRCIDPRAVLCAAGTLGSGYRIRAHGKKSWIERHRADVSLRNTIVVTDSETDADLLSSCNKPILVKWPEAEYRPAMAESYIPFLYTQRAKRPGENYMLYGVLLEDLMLLWLALAWLMPSPALGALGLLLLHLSLWTVYEIGYVENDTLAVKYEAKPKIFDVAAAYADRVVPWKAWFTSVILGALGILLLAETNGPALKISRVYDSPPQLALLGLVTWMGYVMASRFAFWVYNRLDVGSRGHFYVVLQLFRLLGYSLLLHINLVGAMILLSLALARWLKYLVYRSAGKTIDEDQRFLTLMFYGLLLAMGLAAHGTELIGLQAIVALLWFVAYSHRRVRGLAGQVRFLRSS